MRVASHKTLMCNKLCNCLANTPKPIVDQLNAALVKMVAKPAVSARMRSLGSEPWSVQLTNSTSSSASSLQYGKLESRPLVSSLSSTVPIQTRKSISGSSLVRSHLAEPLNAVLLFALWGVYLADSAMP